MTRRFDLWLDSFAPQLSLAITNALRIACRRDSDRAPSVPILISQQSTALGLGGLVEHLKFLIYRLERRPYDPPDISDEELTLTIWPSWMKRF